ncbi:PIN/TRAM domain-containing protein [Roseofilum sp. SID3]|uniref:PIN/TRAM domain-containing protein n=1 Tax=unclassified Roseofilum TaxID=2620099 RepID=UPI001B1CA0D9|nr:PIN/TRAM domain-containing protein [Roseofilum sp. Belize Diploria]MBP0011742.1 PIN/TRAM domain-containing protein [Roseofilum sp. SID3]MBP0024027.1 PIN/TRAM domain-containing protein [Roseofilum sp. SID2]MBP0032709.1 PIN/TRAM domain-containing protein [Roseofilum sp. Belize BBD 4]MBP0039134.1 PIN/TRAM domain-containing protein [Roseofilum sp. SID1]MBP0040641.1 PIN/TRAM domain-containing protein [Roseofilum sp. SBFL]
MIDAIIIISFILAGIGIGFYGVELLPTPVLDQVSNQDGLRSVTAGFAALIMGAVGLFVQTSYRRLEAQVRQMPVEVLLTRSIGLVVGLLVANLMLAPLFLLPIPKEFGFIKPLVAVLGSILFAFSGISLADTHGRSFLRLINPHSMESLLLAEGTLKPATTKIVDTSCIIDGRLEELLATKFIEGQLLVPQFVLQELQLVADAGNDQKRIRGRRGLEILNRIRETYPDKIVIHPADYEEIATVDAKLVHLAQEINGTLLTNDYNLNQVASLQEVSVLNINDLAQAMRPAYLPGDDLDLKIIKQGREPQQGVGYLDDGTMVVVEEGGQYIGVELRVVVTGALQTSAGRMIFARPQVSAIA